jgi:hypothetical protein
MALQGSWENYKAGILPMERLEPRVTVLLEMMQVLMEHIREDRGWEGVLYNTGRIR